MKETDPRPGTRSHRNMLICIAVGKYYDALDGFKYAGRDIDPPNDRLRKRAERSEAILRNTVQEFRRHYGDPKKSDGFPLNIWRACQQPLNVLDFDRAWQESLRSNSKN